MSTNLNVLPSSIDTPLRAFLPATHFDHTLPNAAVCIAACKRGERLTTEIYGDDVAYVGWQRPGFDSGLIMREVASKNPAVRGLIVGQHGLIEKADRYIAAQDKGDRTNKGTPRWPPSCRRSAGK